MRASVASLSKKLISVFFATTLALGLVPAAAFAVEDDPTENESQEQYVGDASASPDGKDGTADNVEADDGSNAGIPANEIINQVEPLQVVAQAESTRSYFLAQTLESTRTVPMVSAQLPIDTGTAGDAVEGDGEETEGGEDSDEPDPVSVIAASSTVVGSFVYRGITYAVEPGGESVVIVAADYSKLPEEFIEAATIVLPSQVSADDIDSYSVARIADGAFSSLATAIAQECVSASGDDIDTASDESRAYDGDTAEDNIAIVSSTIDLTAEDSVIDAATSSVDAGLAPRDREDETRDDARASADSEAASTDDAYGITAITIPASIIDIDDGAFEGFETLRYVIVSEDNSVYGMHDGCLYDASLTTLRLIPEGRVGAVRIAPSATNVDPEVFSHCPSVDTLVADADSAAYELIEENLPQNIDKAIEPTSTDDVTPTVAATYSDLSEDDIEFLEEKDYIASNDDPSAANEVLVRPEATVFEAYSLPVRELDASLLSVVDDGMETRNVSNATSYTVYIGTPQAAYCGSHSENGGSIRRKVLSSAGWHSKTTTAVPSVSKATSGTTGGISVTGFNCNGSGCSNTTWGFQSTVGSGYGTLPTVEYWNPVTQAWVAVAGGTTASLSFKRVTSQYIRLNGYSSSTPTLPKGYVTVTWKTQGGSAVSNWDVQINSALSGNNYTTGTNTTNTALPTTTQTGYTFGGWYASTGLTEASKVSMSTTVAKQDVTYYAKWTENSYTVEYWNKAGTAKVAPDDTGFKYNTNRPLASMPSAGVTSGYVAKGWATSPNQTTATYGFGTSQKMLASSGVKKLYLAEVADPSAVVSNYEIYVGTPQAGYCGSHSYTSPNVRRPVVSSAGWYVRNTSSAPSIWMGTSSTGGGVRVSGFGCDQSGCSNANWGFQQATGGGYGNTPTKVEYYNPVSETWVNVAAGSTVTPSFLREKSLYVRLNGYSTGTPPLPIGYITATWNTNGGSNVTSWDVRIRSALAGNNYTTGTDTKNTALPTSTRPGYTFGGWYTSNTDFSDANKVSMSTTVAKANVTYYARWIPNTYTVQYMSNYDNGPAMQEQSRQYNQSLAPLSVTRPGYELLGWSKDKLGTQTSLPAGAIGKDQAYTIESNLAFTGAIPDSFPLYAVWKAIPYSLKVSTEGSQTTGFGTMELTPSLTGLGAVLSTDERTITANYTCESGAIVLPKPTPASGWKFKGWKLTLDGVEQDGVLESVTIGQPSQGNRVYTAIWVSGDAYDIDYLLGDDLEPLPVWPDGVDAPKTYDVTDSLTIPVPRRDGYVFVGWEVDDEGSATVLSEDANGDMTIATIPVGSHGNKTFTAKWAPVLYAVTLKVAKADLPLVETAFEQSVLNDLPDTVYPETSVRRSDGRKFSSSQTTSMASDNKSVTVPFTYETAEFDLPKGLALSDLWAFSCWTDDDTDEAVSSIDPKAIRDISLTGGWIPIVSIDMPVGEGAIENQATIQLDIVTGLTATALSDEERTTKTFFRTRMPVRGTLSACSVAPTTENEDGTSDPNDDYVRAFFYGDDDGISALISSMRYTFEAAEGIDQGGKKALSFDRRSATGDEGITVLSIADGPLDADGYVDVRGTLDLSMDPLSSINDTVRIRQMEDPDLQSVLDNMDPAIKHLSRIVWTIDATGWNG